MLYSIIAHTTIWLLAAHEWNLSTFGITTANAGVLQTVRFFISLVADSAEFLYFNKLDTLALRDL